MITEPIEKGWILCALEYGEPSPLENHHAFELGADNPSKRIYASVTFIRAMGLDSILAACRGYIHKQEKIEP